MAYKVDITKKITINGVVFEEGDALRIEHNLSTVKDEEGLCLWRGLSLRYQKKIL